VIRRHLYSEYQKRRPFKRRKHKVKFHAPRQRTTLGLFEEFRNNDDNDDNIRSVTDGFEISESDDDLESLNQKIVELSSSLPIKRNDSSVRVVREKNDDSCQDYYKDFIKGTDISKNDNPENPNNIDIGDLEIRQTIVKKTITINSKESILFERSAPFIESMSSVHHKNRIKSLFIKDFDKLKEFSIYYPHNNVSPVIQYMRKKRVDANRQYKGKSSRRNERPGFSFANAVAEQLDQMKFFNKVKPKKASSTPVRKTKRSIFENQS
jgi:hypothetical protein